MNLMKWNPWNEFSDMEKFIGFPGFSQNFTLALDVYDKDDKIVVEAPLAGIDPEKVQIAIENDILTIEGTVEKKNEIDEKNYYRKEVRSGSFHRSIALPTSVEGDQAEAQYKDGILQVTIPKAAKSTPRTIKVKNIK